MENCYGYSLYVVLDRCRFCLKFIVLFFLLYVSMYCVCIHTFNFHIELHVIVYTSVIIDRLPQFFSVLSISIAKQTIKTTTIFGYKWYICFQKYNVLLSWKINRYYHWCWIHYTIPIFKVPKLHYNFFTLRTINLILV